MEKIEIDGVMLEGWYGINARREDFETYLEVTNGCGAGNAPLDFVPDTMYGLCIKAICNLHDDAFVFCPPDRQSFDKANEELYSNLRKWIYAKSGRAMRYPRYLRAYIYYLAVSYLGYSAFKACKKELGMEVQDGGRM